jgi:hypothetical protein
MRTLRSRDMLRPRRQSKSVRMMALKQVEGHVSVSDMGGMLQDGTSKKSTELSRDAYTL